MSRWHRPDRRGKVYLPWRKRPLGIIFEAGAGENPSHVGDRPVANFEVGRGNAADDTVTYVNTASYRTESSGGDEGITIPEHTSFSSPTSFTVSFWAKSPTPGSNNGWFSWRWGSDTDHFGWIVRPGSTFTLGLEMVVWSSLGFSDPVTTAYTIRTPGTDVHILDDVWQHFVFVYPGGGSTNSRIYKNGVSQTVEFIPNVPGFPATIHTATDQVLHVMASTPGAATRHIDEFAFYNTGLTDAQCSALYDSSGSLDLATLDSFSNCVIWLKADGDTYPTATDHALSNDGTLGSTMDQSDIDTTEVPP